MSEEIFSFDWEKISILFLLKVWYSHRKMTPYALFSLLLYISSAFWISGCQVSSNLEKQFRKQEVESLELSQKLLTVEQELKTIQEELKQLKGVLIPQITQILQAQKGVQDALEAKTLESQRELRKLQGRLTPPPLP